VLIIAGVKLFLEYDTPVKARMATLQNNQKNKKPLLLTLEQCYSNSATVSI
jgi:hypothetical protein